MSYNWNSVRALEKRNKELRESYQGDHNTYFKSQKELVEKRKKAQLDKQFKDNADEEL